MSNVTEEIFRLRYETDIEQKVPRLQALLKATEDRITRIRLAQEKPISKDAFRALEESAVRYAQELRKAQIRLEEFQVKQDAIRAKNDALKENAIAMLQYGDAVENAGAKGAKGGRDLGTAMLQAGYALEDMNYGLMGVMNNIPMLVQSMGGGAGVAGVVAAVGAAVLMLSRNWGTLQEKFGQGIPQPALKGLEGINKELEKLNEQIDKLQNKGRLNFGEFVDLEKAKFQRGEMQQRAREQQAVDDLKQMGQFDEAAAAGFKEGAKEFGGQRLIDALRNALQAAGGANQLGIAGKPDDIAAKLIEGAMRGSAQSIEEIARLVPGAGVALRRGLPGIRDGMGIDEVVAQQKAMTEDYIANNPRPFEEGGMMAGVVGDYKAGAFDEFMAQRKAQQANAAERNIQESFDREAQIRISEMYGIDERANQVFRQGAASGRMDEAAEYITSNLAAALESTLPEDEAREQAEKYVRARREEFERGLAEEKMDPENLRSARMALAQNQLSMMGLMDSFAQGPRTMDAGSFARTVQDSQSPLKDQMDIMRKQLTAQELMVDRMRLLERIAILQ